MSLYITSKTNDFEVDYGMCAIDVRDGNYEIALLNAGLWYSWDNIKEEFENNKIKYSDNKGADWVTLTLPNGLYDWNELNRYLEEYFVSFDQSPILFDENNATKRGMLIINGHDYKVDFSEGKLYELLGFEAKIYEERLNYASKMMNITRDVDQLLIHCSIVRGSYQDNLPSDVIYGFIPNAEPGSLINIEPFNPKYLPILEQNGFIRRIRIKVTDQLNRLIDFNGENLTFVFDLKLI